jgi:hypothetical protein
MTLISSNQWLITSLVQINKKSEEAKALAATGNHRAVGSEEPGASLSLNANRHEQARHVRSDPRKQDWKARPPPPLINRCGFSAN